MHNLNRKIFAYLKNPFTCSHWESANYRVFLKSFLSDENNPFTHLDKGGRNAHPFPSFFSKIFWEKILPFTYLELQSQMTPYFTEKMRKYFFGCRCFILLAKKSPFTYSHWEWPNAPPNLKKIYPFTYLELRSRNAPCFHKKFEKYFVFGCGTAYFCLSKKSFHLFGIGVSKRNLFQRKIFEKDKKICPPEVASKEF